MYGWGAAKALFRGIRGRALTQLLCHGWLGAMHPHEYDYPRTRGRMLPPEVLLPLLDIGTPFSPVPLQAW